MNFFDSFTKGAQRVLIIAQEEARRMGHNYVGTEHILLGTIKEKSSVSTLLSQLGVTYEKVCAEIENLIGMGDFNFSEAFGYTPRTKRVLEMSKAEANKLGQNYVGTEHILFALLLETEGVANRILRDLGVNTKELYEKMIAATVADLKKRGQNPGAAGESGRAAGGEKKDGEESAPTLMQYGRDLTRAARAGELDPVIGRAEEIERIIQILSRRTKNNPVLIGEPGVGKSAVAEGLAQKIAEGNVPELLRGKRIVSLDLAGMLAGAKYRGEFEERMKNVMEELKRDRNIILFIDELHTLIGAGAAEGAIDAANILKPALARGEIQCIGATTLDEYRKHIEKDAALERRFQPVTVGEPSPEEAVEILKGLRDRYEAHHKVRITDEAIAAAVQLSDRYITDRYLPDKAIDLIDEAASRVRIRSFITPPDMKQMEEKLEQLNKEKEEAIAHQDFERAAKVRDEERAIRADMENQRKEWENKRSTAQKEVGEEDVAEIVAAWTHIPVTKLTEDESSRLLHLEDALHKRVIGQDEAVSAVARAIRRARAGLKDEKRPIGSFLFLGPTGVGKTELCKALAEAMFGDESAMVRIDMSEYMEKFSVSRMIGSPPGYVGHEEGGQLTEAVRRKPYSVVLFDEIEKAHPDVFNILLQVLEDGRLTDSTGRTVDFRNTICVMTSNVGAADVGKNARGLGFTNDRSDLSVQSYERMKEAMLEELKRTFRPEFLNRVDELIVFHPLDEENILRIAGLMVQSVAARLAERDIHLTWDDEALQFLAKEGFDPTYGARPLRRAIQRMVEDDLSEEILSGRVALGDKVHMSVQEGKLTFTRDSTLGNAFSDALRNNNVDMLFGVGWTGSTFDPYNLMTAYTTSNYQYDPAWDTSTAMLDITIDDVTYTASVLDWTNAISGLEITATTADGEEATLSFPYSTDEHEAELRITVLGELENAVLQNYNFIPLMNDSGATVVGMQVQYYTDEEVFPMGYGGVQYLTYNYTDAEWEAYVAEQGGTLNYR